MNSHFAPLVFAVAAFGTPFAFWFLAELRRQQQPENLKYTRNDILTIKPAMSAAKGLFLLMMALSLLPYPIHW
jgi:hypothetical protein